jgi:hypothetical protein
MNPHHDVIRRDTSKGNYGAPVFDQMAVAEDSFATMCAFLHLDKHQRFTESDRKAIKHDLKRLAQCVGQMDAGQRGKGVSFNEVPHVMGRLAVACMRLKLSGKLDEMEVDG